MAPKSENEREVGLRSISIFRSCSILFPIRWISKL